MGFSYEPPSVPPGRQADLLFAATYNGQSSSPWTIIPNVTPMGVNWYEGSRPPDARFRYRQGVAGMDTKLPTRMEQVFPLDAQGNGVIQPDTRLGVFRLDAQGNPQILFDGYTQAPEVEANEETESLTFVAVGTPIREWDQPLEFAVYRDASQPDQANADTKVKLRARFNPDGKYNATMSGDPSANPPTGDSYRPDTGNYYPVFIGPVWPENQINGFDIRAWTLEMAARYIVVVGCTTQYTNYSVKALTNTLVALVPAQDNGNIDFTDSTTFTTEPIEVQDFDCSGMAWPEALERLISPHGFGMCWRLEQDQQGNPNWRLDVYRQDVPTPAKQIYLQALGATFDPGQTNVGGMHLTRDSHAIANSIHVATDLIRIECSVILAPNFPISQTDATVGSLPRWVDGNPAADPKDNRTYREFILDEAGEGHWNVAGGQRPPGVQVSGGKDAVPKDFVKKVLSTKLVWQDPQVGQKTPQILNRRRIPINKLCTLGADKEPLTAKLHVSFDYGRNQPAGWKAGGDGKTIDPCGLWDGSGTWDEVPTSAWGLLDDRIGIFINHDDPNDILCVDPEITPSAYTGAWGKGTNWDGNSPLANEGGRLLLVRWLASPGVYPDDSTVTENTDVPVFRLTCSFDADQDLRADIDAKGMTPTQFKIRRQVDATTRFHRDVVSKYSMYASPAGNKGKDTTVVDDIDDAKAMAATTVRVHQNAIFAGAVTIPRITTAYQPGDRITSLVGRGVNLVTNTGVQQGASPIYPTVVAVSIDNDGRQSTSIQLSDKRSEFAAMKSHRKRPGFAKNPPAKGVRAGAVHNREFR